MPIYEYRCTACNHELEKIQKMSDAPLTDCPACDQPALTKLISAAGFRLKGGGWYETDFKKDGKRNLAGDGESGKASDSGIGEKATASATSGDKPGTSGPAADKAA